MNIESKHPECLVDLTTEGARSRHKLFDLFANALYVVARRQMQEKGNHTDSFVLTCIEVHSNWKYIVEALLPSYNLEELDHVDGKPVMHGAVPWALCTHLAEVAPHLAEILLRVPQPNQIKVIILAASGITVYDIDMTDRRKMN